MNSLSVFQNLREDMKRIKEAMTKQAKDLCESQLQLNRLLVNSRLPDLPSSSVWFLVFSGMRWETLYKRNVKQDVCESNVEFIPLSAVQGFNATFRVIKNLNSIYF